MIAMVTDVSIFALSLSTALGLALAIDYTLLIVTRYRDEISHGAHREQALIRTMRTAGRTVVFSATTVALSMRRWCCSRCTFSTRSRTPASRPWRCAWPRWSSLRRPSCCLGPAWTLSTFAAAYAGCCAATSRAKTYRQLFWYRWANR